MSLTQYQFETLTEIAKAAVVSERVTGCPAELSAAQCILESDWLHRSPANNAFGIKHTSGPDNYQVTQEYLDGTWKTLRLDFQAYDSLDDCFLAHAHLLVDGAPYKDAWDHYREDPEHCLDTLIAGVCRRYATDPAYTEKVLTLSRGPHVLAAIAAARLNGTT